MAKWEIPPFKQLEYTTPSKEDLRKLVDVINDNFNLIRYKFDGNVNATNLTETIISDLEISTGGDEFDIRKVLYHSNKCANSSFERFTSALLPYYWDTVGTVSDDSNFDGDYSLKLTPSQTATQQVESDGGLWDPSWWPWTTDTRISFRCKAADNTGKIKVEVLNASDVAQNLAYRIYNAVSGKWETTSGVTYIEFDSGAAWPSAFQTFTAQCSASGYHRLKFTNTGSIDIYIDSVTIEGDWGTNWPSLYRPGVRSEPIKEDFDIRKVLYHSNKCANSSFEIFDAATNIPYYWNTSCVVSPDSNFEGNYTLKMEPDDTAEQKNESDGGLWTPSWWEWTNNTRFSFRCKSNSGGKIKVEVLDSDNIVKKLSYKEFNPASGRWTTINDVDYIEFTPGYSWPESLFTFTAGCSGPKYHRLKFTNSGDSDIYLDAVTVEPDWGTGWPSIYHPGVKSVPHVESNGHKIFISDTDPGSMASEGDIWIDIS